jgi:hypothetical protein
MIDVISKVMSYFACNVKENFKFVAVIFVETDFMALL